MAWTNTITQRARTAVKYFLKVDSNFLSFIQKHYKQTSNKNCIRWKFPIDIDINFTMLCTFFHLNFFIYLSIYHEYKSEALHCCLYTHHTIYIYHHPYTYHSSCKRQNNKKRLFLSFLVSMSILASCNISICIF